MMEPGQDHHPPKFEELQNVLWPWQCLWPTWFWQLLDGTSMHETFRSNEWMYVTKNICCCRYNICPLCFFPDGCCHGGRRWAIKRKGGAFNRGTDKGEQQAFAWQAKERACPSFHTCTDHWNKKRPDSNRRGRQYKEFCSWCVLASSQGVYINIYTARSKKRYSLDRIDHAIVWRTKCTKCIYQAFHNLGFSSGWKTNDERWKDAVYSCLLYT